MDRQRITVTTIARINASLLAIVLALATTSSVRSASAITYRLSFPEREHHWMQVEATFTELQAGPLELRMSRSSPGRYSLHDFAKNVYDVAVTGSDGRALAVTRPDPSGWTVPEHGPSVTVRYRVFGDRVDGTYLGIDPSHAHINMPAAIMWGRGLDDRPVTVTFVQPSSARWQVATQLHPGSNAFEFTAPNLQYLMDSPTEFGPVTIKEFVVEGHTFRFAVHHTGTAAEVDGFVRDVEKIVRQEGAIFGEFPPYEPGRYTFLADYLPYANGDGMEHRNSTVITSSNSIRVSRSDLLDTVAHEFFHCWNVERIRPRSLEPFDLERVNMSGELWLAEGFTQYYEFIVLSRSGLAGLPQTLGPLSGFIQSVSATPGHDVRSAEDMSRMAGFTDGSRTNDRTNWENTYVSYYQFGGAIAFALDLSLRGRSNGQVTLDDFMRAMWRMHGKPGGSREGYVDRPYTIDDAERRLAEVSGDASFAHEFFARYIHGHDIPEYGKLLQPAGLAIRRTNPGRAWWGEVRIEQQNGARIASTPLANSPAYKAGLDVDDVVRQFDGTRISTAEDIAAVLRRHKPGDTIAVEFSDRAGATTNSTVTLGEDPQMELVSSDAIGVTVTPAQQAFRRAWLGR